MAFSITGAHLIPSFTSVTIVWAWEEPMWSLAGVAILARAGWSSCMGPLLLRFSTQQIPVWWIHLLYPPPKKTEFPCFIPIPELKFGRDLVRSEIPDSWDFFFLGAFLSSPQIMIAEVMMIDKITEQGHLWTSGHMRTMKKIMAAFI